MTDTFDPYAIVLFYADELTTMGLPTTNGRYLLYWKHEGIVIRWPAGVTPKEAILTWAQNQSIVKPIPWPEQETVRK